MRDSRHTVRGEEPATPEGSTPTASRLPDGQYADHWVLSENERKQGWVRPLRKSYVHDKCGGSTRMPLACAETYARDPSYYGSTFCAICQDYFPVGASGEFTWQDGSGERVGT